VGVEGVVLEDHRDVAVTRRQIVHAAVADVDAALADLLQPGQHTKGGGLAAPRGADEDQELGVVDVDGEVGDGELVAVLVALVDVVEDNLGHRILFLHALSTGRPTPHGWFAQTAPCPSPPLRCPTPNVGVMRIGDAEIVARRREHASGWRG
jgi:hypothetical protein